MHYLIWITTFIVIPTTVLIFTNFDLIWRYRKTLLCTEILTLVFAIPWDIYAVKSGIWFFPSGGTMGLTILGLPIEEYIFMISSALLFSSLTIIFKYKLRLS